MPASGQTGRRIGRPDLLKLNAKHLPDGPPVPNGDAPRRPRCPARARLAFPFLRRPQSFDPVG